MPPPTNSRPLASASTGEASPHRPTALPHSSESPVRSDLHRRSARQWAASGPHEGGKARPYERLLTGSRLWSGLPRRPRLHDGGLGIHSAMSLAAGSREVFQCRSARSDRGMFDHRFSLPKVVTDISPKV